MAINLNDYRITILCEDNAQYNFLYGYARLLGANQRKIKRLFAHNNSTVLKKYANAVKKYRQQHKENIILVAMIDADENSVSERLRSFDKALDEEKYRLNQATRLENEKILIFVPVRNIESWFHYIATGDADVEVRTDEDGRLLSYKSQYQNNDAFDLAQKLKTEICIDGLPENAPSSLHHACKELERL